jgi:hypothetical protein
MEEQITLEEPLNEIEKDRINRLEMSDIESDVSGLTSSCESIENSSPNTAQIDGRFLIFTPLGESRAESAMTASFNYDEAESKSSSQQSSD